MTDSCLQPVFYTELKFKIIITMTIIIAMTSLFVMDRARRQYWEDVEPASGRPYSSAFSHPDNWGVTAVSSRAL